MPDNRFYQSSPSSPPRLAAPSSIAILPTFGDPFLQLRTHALQPPHGYCTCSPAFCILPSWPFRPFVKKRLSTWISVAICLMIALACNFLRVLSNFLSASSVHQGFARNVLSVF